MLIQRYCKYLFLMVLMACTNNQEVQLDRIQVDVNRSTNKYTFDDFFVYSHHIVLETTEESLLSFIDKLQIQDERVYILDRSEKSIFVFDLEGRFVNRMNRFGQSSNEYISVSDIDVSDNGQILVNDYLGRKILKYDANGDFIEAIHTPASSRSFKFLGKHRYALDLRNGVSTGEDNYNYICFEKDAVIEKAVPFNKNLLGYTFSYGYGNSSFYLYDNELYLTALFNDTLFSITKEGLLAPHLVYQFGVDKPQLNWSLKETNQYRNDQRTGERVSSIYHFNKFGAYYFISYDYREGSNYVISKKNSDPEFVGTFDKDINGLYIIPLTYLSDSSDNFFATIVFPNNIASLLKRCNEYQDSSLLKELSETVEADDNPIIVFYRWVFPG